MDEKFDFMFFLPDGKVVTMVTTMEKAIELCRRRVRDRVWQSVSLSVLCDSKYIEIGKYRHSDFFLPGKKNAELNEAFAVEAEPVLPKYRY